MINDRKDVPVPFQKFKGLLAQWKKLARSRQAEEDFENAPAYDK